MMQESNFRKKMGLCVNVKLSENSDLPQQMTLVELCLLLLLQCTYLHLPANFSAQFCSTINRRLLLEKQLLKLITFIIVVMSHVDMMNTIIQAYLTHKQCFLHVDLTVVAPHSNISDPLRYQK